MRLIRVARVRVALVLLLATALLGTSCMGDDEPAADTGATEAGALRIFAERSLEAVFRELAPDAHFRFGNSDELAALIQDAAAVDVFAAASSDPMGELRQRSLVESPVAFATNRLVLVAPAGNPAGIESLDDLAGLGLMVGAEPEYARATLEAIGKGHVLDNVDYLPDAAEAVGSGTLDSAFVYFTDAQAAGDAVEVIDLPAQVLAEYLVAPSTTSERYDAAEAFVQLLLSDRGRQALEEAGFALPPAG
jgi:molybdate transport system substrate-binding protein